MDEQESRQLAMVAKAEQPFQKYFLQIVMIIFVAGGGWVTLSNIAALAEDNKEEIEATKEQAQVVENKLVRIETRQEQIIMDIAEQKVISEKILEELRKLQKTGHD